MENQNTSPLLSIIIVNWNTKALLENCLRSIDKYWYAMSSEIIVIDNASSDGSVQMVKSMFPDVILIENNENIGFVKANNQGSEIAKGHNLLLLNSDTEILDADIDKILTYMDLHPEVGAVTGKVLNSDKTFQRPFRLLPHPLGAFFRHTTRLIWGAMTPIHKHYLMLDYSPDQVHDVPCITGAYYFVRSKFRQEGAIFDRELSMYYEDTLLSYRVIQSGAKIKYLPYAKIIHFGGSSTQQVRAWSTFKSFQGSVFYFRKTESLFVASIYQFFIIVFWKLIKASLFIFHFIPLPAITKKYAFFVELLHFYHTEMN